MEKKIPEEILCEKLFKEENYFIDKNGRITLNGDAVNAVLLALVTLKTDFMATSVSVANWGFKEEKEEFLKSLENEKEEK